MTATTKLVLSLVFILLICTYLQSRQQVVHYFVTYLSNRWDRQPPSWDQRQLIWKRFYKSFTVTLFTLINQYKQSQNVLQNTPPLPYPFVGHLEMRCPQKQREGHKLTGSTPCPLSPSLVQIDLRDCRIPYLPKLRSVTPPPNNHTELQAAPCWPLLSRYKRPSTVSPKASP